MELPEFNIKNLDEEIPNPDEGLSTEEKYKRYLEVEISKNVAKREAVEVEKNKNLKVKEGQISNKPTHSNLGEKMRRLALPVLMAMPGVLGMSTTGSAEEKKSLEPASQEASTLVKSTDAEKEIKANLKPTVEAEMISEYKKKLKPIVIDKMEEETETRIKREKAERRAEIKREKKANEARERADKKEEKRKAEILDKMRAELKTELELTLKAKEGKIIEELKTEINADKVAAEKAKADKILAAEQAKEKKIQERAARKADKKAKKEAKIRAEAEAKAEQEAVLAKEIMEAIQQKKNRIFIYNDSNKTLDVNDVRGPGNIKKVMGLHPGAVAYLTYGDNGANITIETHNFLGTRTFGKQMVFTGSGPQAAVFTGNNAGKIPLIKIPYLKNIFMQYNTPDTDTDTSKNNDIREEVDEEKVKGAASTSNVKNLDAGGVGGKNKKDSAENEAAKNKATIIKPSGEI